MTKMSQGRALNCAALAAHAAARAALHAIHIFDEALDDPSPDVIVLKQIISQFVAIGDRAARLAESGDEQSDTTWHGIVLTGEEVEVLCEALVVARARYAKTRAGARQRYFLDTMAELIGRLEDETGKSALERTWAPRP